MRAESHSVRGTRRTGLRHRQPPGPALLPPSQTLYSVSRSWPNPHRAGSTFLLEGKPPQILHVIFKSSLPRTEGRRHVWQSERVSRERLDGGSLGVHPTVPSTFLSF